jgi:excisionase family DNA binding protein
LIARWWLYEGLNKVLAPERIGGGSPFFKLFQCIWRSRNLEELISPKELSKLLKVSKPWPYIMVKRGVLPCYKMGGLVRFKRSDVEAYLERSRLEAKRS